MDKKYMLRAIELAKKGLGFANPNPMVGAVIVKDGRIIGEGYHEKCGQLHAERNALASLTESAEGADMYVTLEPCCHYGRTAPCTEAIIEHKIGRVFIGSRDPNPKVAGKGAKILADHGIEVVRDFCRRECDEINPVFFHHITKKRPYIVMKYAMTLDGKIATFRGKSKWITGQVARDHVHQLRARYAGILCGIGTVLADDPMLNARILGAHQPLRIVVDSSLRIPLDCQLVKTAGEYETLVVCALKGLDEKFNYVNEMSCNGANLDSGLGSRKSVELNTNQKVELSVEQFEKVKALREAGCQVISLPGVNGRVDLRALVYELYERQIDSVLVEGGGQVHDGFREAKLVDHVCCYIAPKIFGGADAKTPVEGRGVGETEEALVLRNQKITVLGDDLLLEYDCGEELGFDGCGGEG